MFELSRQSTIASAHCPVIDRIQLGETAFLVDHRFNREAQARKQSLLPTLAIRHVWDIGVLMKATPQTVADILADDRKATFVR
jgi:hypothetical protein